MPRIIWWVISAAILTAGTYAFVAEKKSILVADDGAPARFQLSFGKNEGKVAGESTGAAESIASKAGDIISSFVPKAIVDLVIDPGRAAQEQVAGVRQSAAQAVKNEIADLFNIATATPTGIGAEQMANSTSGTPCIP